MQKWWGGPPGPHGTPSSRSFLEESGAANLEELARGPAADEGVRPTNYAGVLSKENYVHWASACQDLLEFTVPGSLLAI